MISFKPNPEQAVYTSSDGRKTPIAEMVDTHLVHTVRKIERQGSEHPQYHILKAELERRPAAVTFYNELAAKA